MKLFTKKGTWDFSHSVRKKCWQHVVFIILIQLHNSRQDMLSHVFRQRVNHCQFCLCEPWCLTCLEVKREFNNELFDFLLVQ